MRVLIAPDCFGNTLTATEAAEAIAAGWRAVAADELLLRPLSDGGPGFVQVLHGTLGGTLHTETVAGPLGDPVDAVWLEHEDTAYVESAQACGLHLTQERDPLNANTRGVGELVSAAKGCSRIVIGLGGSATSDGGAGFLETVGEVTAELVIASDVTNPFLGPHGAAAVFAPQKGATPAQVAELAARHGEQADRLQRRYGIDVGYLPGGGAAGGLGAALLALGARLESGAGLVARLIGLADAMDAAQLVLTGEGSFDWQSLRGKLVTSVAGQAAERGLPCLVLAGQVSVGRREAAAAGVEDAYSAAELAGSATESMARPAHWLAELSSTVAGQWTRPHR
ncbi:glycerate kinase [Pseudonocardiaceae bacterium YIM PH 21723]|nr:glycerate kinase [Pseudonocardiaceae bacterium YIM PH 21723]